MPDNNQQLGTSWNDPSTWGANTFLGPKWAVMAKALGGAASDTANLAAVPVEASDTKPETPGMWSDVDEAKRQLNQATIVPAITQMALSLMGGGVPAAEEGAAGIFGGRLAKTAEPLQLLKAKMAESLGGSPVDVYNDTGWFRGADKQWRFEIPDTRATVSHGLPSTLGEALDHPALYEAYPDMKNIEMRWDQAPGFASHLNPTKSLPEAIGLSPGDTPQALIPSVLHEAQHSVQMREGFAPGSSPVKNEPYAAEALEKLGLIKRLTPYLYQPLHENADELLRQAAFKAYQRHAGEVEARNVSNRYTYGWSPNRDASLLDYSKYPPFQTEDVKRENQIVRPPYPYVKALLGQ
jgi:hypothetical protein